MVVLLAIIAALGFAQQKKLGELLVFNNWSAPAELGALNVIRQAYLAKGGTWKDISIAHDTGASIPLINMLTGGNPPDVFMENGEALRRELYKQGLLYDFTAVYNSMNIDRVVPPSVKNAMMVDGKILSAPLGIHIVGTIFWNKAAAAKAGVDPASWKSMEDMFADFPKIRKANIIPLAIGAQKWQLEYLMESMLAQVSGKLYDDICGNKPNRAAIDSPEMRKALAYFRQIQKESDPGSANRNWNDTTALVIRGEALMQLHGDWMKGEWVGAKKKIGVDFDSRLVPGAASVQVTVDEMSFLAQKDPAKRAGVEELFKIMMQRITTEKFAAIKGSTPIRTDAVTGQDKHSRTVLASIAKPNFGYLVANITMDPDWKTSFQNLSDQFWNTPDMTADQFIKEAQGQFDQIFKK
jgi:glucose/mannose transport system substrate-binding protein